MPVKFKKRLAGTFQAVKYYSTRHFRGDLSRYRGVYNSYSEALAAVKKTMLAGYNQEKIVGAYYETMCEVVLWDWPIIYYLKDLMPQYQVLLDAGGHMGTKYRAFRKYLPESQTNRWIVYDLPHVVQEGRVRAKSENLSNLEFIDDMNSAPKVDLLLASGLLQYLDIPFHAFLESMKALPQHLLLNKVAVHDLQDIYTLQTVHGAEVPYCIRNMNDFAFSLGKLGYEIVDKWHIDELNHVVYSGLNRYESNSIGMYCMLRN
jgi:putative methyltransferase (TIGR04325 family)